MSWAARPGRASARHLDTDELSAAAREVGAGVAAGSVHLNACSVCRSRVDNLVLVIETLAGLDRPALPEPVGIRIDAALAREVERAESVDRLSDLGRRRRFASRRFRALPWVAAGVMLVAGGLGAAALGGVFGAGAAASSPPSAAGARSTTGPQQAPARFSSVPAPVRSAASPALNSWALTLLAAVPGTSGKASSDAGNGSGKGFGATESGRAGNAATSLCAADPEFAGLTPVAAAAGTFDGVAAELVVYQDAAVAGPAYAVAFALPCSAATYRVLAAGTVTH